MLRQLAAAVAVLAVAGCHLNVRPPAALGPLQDEAEVAVYLNAIPAETVQLTFALSSLALQREDGQPVPLRLELTEISAGAAGRQRLLAHGRVPPGRYAGLVAGVTKATIVGRDGKPAALSLPEGPTVLPQHLLLEARRGTILALAFRPDLAVSPAYAFTPAFDAAVPFRPATDLLAVATVPAAAGLAVFDRRARTVIGLWPTGAEPAALALDLQRGRLYVALAGEDAVQVFELATGAERGRATLRPGDRPSRLVLSTDGSRLLTVNRGTDTMSFIDPDALVETDRLAVGREPSWLVLTKGGKTAYVLSPRDSTITVVDVASRQVARTIPTDVSPSLARLAPGEALLYVVYQGSPYLSVLDLAAGTVRRVLVGAAVEALLVEPRRGLILVGLRGEPRVTILDPTSLLPIGSIDLPGPPQDLAIDDIENALVVTAPAARAIGTFDLGSRKRTGQVDLWAAPGVLALPDERR